MVDAENIPESESYKQLCYARARYYLQDAEIENAFELLLFEKDMNPDEIKAAAEIIHGLESGDTDID